MTQPYYNRRLALGASDETYLSRFADSPRTRAANRSALKAFLMFRAWHGRAQRTPTPLSQLSLDVLVEFRNWLTRRQYAPLSRDNYITLVAQYLRYHQDQDALPAAFSTERALHRNKQTRPRHAYPVKEIPSELPRIIQFFDALPTKEDPLARLEHLRNRAVMHTLYASAGRVSEIASLTRKEVQDGRRNKAKVLGKGGKERFIYLTDEAGAAIQAYCAAREDTSESLFIYHRRKAGERMTRQSIWNLIDAAAEALHVAHVSPHDFRHYRARQMLEQGAPLDAIQEILGHSNIETTRKVYALTSPEKARSDFDKYTVKVANLP